MAGDVWVSGYFRSDGTWVNGYWRTAPDSTKNNNYSTVGNVNPYTNEAGTKPGGTNTISTSTSGSTPSATTTNGATPPTLSIAATDAAKAEGNSLWSSFTFTVTRAGTTAGTSSVAWSVAGSGANAADAADFFLGKLPSGFLYFLSGDTSETITIDVVSDTKVESSETFVVTLSNATGAAITAATATGTIVNDDIDPARRLAITAGGVSREKEMEAYSGPVSGLQNMYLGTDEDEALSGTDRADFINARGGNDAIAGGAGDDVLDGGTGSNFLTGGTGKDTFFVDGRGTGVTWSTVTDLEKGEWVTAWGWQPGISKLTWAEMSGAAGYKGATAHIDLDGNGSVDLSMTVTGKTSGSILVTPGNVNGSSYLAFTLS